jgi:hypothetical protein
MPLKLKIDHSRQFVRIDAEGPVTRQDLEAHFDEMVVENALGYAKLFVAVDANPVYDDHDVLMMGARLSAYAANFDGGPLAVVGQSEEALLAFKRFVNIAPSKRPAAFFAKEAEGLAWLESKRPPDAPRLR